MSSLFVLFFLYCILCTNSQESFNYNLTPNGNVSYYHSSNCPRTGWCLALNSGAELFGSYYQNYSWPSQFSISFWYYIYDTNKNNANYNNNNRNQIIQHNIISNCYKSSSNNVKLISDETSFFLITESIKSNTSDVYYDDLNFEVYFNNSHQCNKPINSNKTKCFKSSYMLYNNWQYITITYTINKNFTIYSNGTYVNSIHWSNLRSIATSNNLLCIGDGYNNNNGYIQLLTDIRFYNKTLTLNNIKHLYDLDHSLTYNDNHGIFAYYDFVNHSTNSNINHLCLTKLYVSSIKPLSISLDGDTQIIHLYGNGFNNNIQITLFNKESNYRYIIESTDIFIQSSTYLYFNTPSSIRNISCTNSLYIIVNNVNCNPFNNNNNISIALYSSSIQLIPDKVYASNPINISILSSCFPPHDRGLMCYLYENNKLIRTNIKANIVSNNQVLCIFNDLSQHLSSNQYAIQIYSKSYNYSTSQTQFTLYNQPYIYKLSSNVFSDSNTTGSLLINATNLISNQLFNCNIIDNNNNNNKHYISSGHVNINNLGYCPIYGSLIKPSSDLLFYISIGSYFNSSLIPFTITNGIPCLSCTYFYGSGICSSHPCPSSSYQVFYTQIIDYSGYNYTNHSSAYTFSMYSHECPSLLFSVFDYRNGTYKWSYYAPPAFTSSLNFSCLINFTASHNVDNIDDYYTFYLNFVTLNPEILYINNTLFACNNATNNLYITTNNLYLNNRYFYVQNSNNNYYILSNNVSIRCYLNEYSFTGVLVSNNIENNIQIIQCLAVYIPESAQYLFKFSIKIFEQYYISQPYNKSLIYFYNLPQYKHISPQKIDSNTHVNNIYIYGLNLFIAENVLYNNRWDIKCIFGSLTVTSGKLINNSLIICNFNDPKAHSSHSSNHIYPIIINYTNNQNPHQQILLSTNQSLNIINNGGCSSNCNGHGYCDNQNQCHCNIGYYGNSCDIPLYYIIGIGSVILYILISIILIYKYCLYKRKYIKMKRYLKHNSNNNNNSKIKYYGYKPIEDLHNDNICCCCFNLTRKHYGYWICCQFCCFCEERTTKILLPNDDDSDYTSTYHEKPKRPQQMKSKKRNITAVPDIVYNADEPSNDRRYR